MAKRKNKSVLPEETLEEETNVPTVESETTEEPVNGEPTESVEESLSEESVEEPVEPSEETPEEETPKEPEEEKTVSAPETHTVEIVYTGTSEKATVRGKVTGQKYEFYKDMYGMPTATSVDERDSSGILALRGKACCGKDPYRLFATKNQWDIEINNAKTFNR